jgi:ubiquinone/menaquinone biosynthesis C-methylase UbiE
MLDPEGIQVVAKQSGFSSIESEQVVRTRGLLVTGRAGIVDTLENLISGGQQEDILAATLSAALVDEGDRLVDVGCGTGKLAVAASRLVGAKGSVVGIDATPQMIDLANARSAKEKSGARFRVGVAEHLPLPAGSQDAVTSSYFFHHLPSDLKPLAMREM